MNVSRSALLPYSAAQMYDVIVDVRSYPEFLNWCHGMEVLSEQEGEVIAKLMIAYGKLNFSFTTRNRMSLNEAVMLNLVDGPFSDLQGQWSIQELNQQACKVSLDMRFTFDNKITQKLFGRVFKNVIAAQLDAFQKRAAELYGSQ